MSPSRPALLLLLAVATSTAVASKAEDEKWLSLLSNVRGVEAKLDETIAGKKTLIEGAIYKAGPCKPGYYQETPKSPCTICPAGSFCPGGKLGKKTACPAGFATPLGVTGLSSADDCFVVCAPGEYALVTQGPDAQCYTCGLGFFCPGGPQNTPLEVRESCPIGSTTITDGATQITQCVVTCPPGQYSNFSTGPCSDCGKNFYCEGGPQVTPGRDACAAVDPVLQTPFTNTTTGSSPADCVGCRIGTALVDGTCRVICAPGYFSPTEIADSCDICPANSYCPGGPQPTPGNVTLCTAPLVSPPGSDSVDDCVQSCAPGFYSPDSVSTCIACGDGFYCAGGIQTNPPREFCPAGTFTVSPYTAADVGDCLQCAQGTPPTCQATICQPGYYEATVNAGCTVCPVDSYCPGGTQPPGGIITLCPDGLITTTDASTGLSACVRSCPAGTYASTPTAACVTCGVPYYCPGGPQTVPKRNPCPQSPPPPYTTLAPDSDSQLDCVIVCPAGQYALTPQGPCITCLVGSACAGGPQPNPVIITCADAGLTTCSASATECVNTETSSTNCGACGIVCPVGSVCTGGTCVCAADGQPVATATSLTCGRNVEGKQAVSTYQVQVKPGGTYSLVYDSLSVPDRYIVRFDSPCGPTAYDTGFTGVASRGCEASSPCCLASDYPSADPPCTGSTVNGQTYCPPNQSGSGPPGGKGAGTTPNFVIPAGTTSVYITAFGVCGGTVNNAKLAGANGGTCPRL